MVAPVLFYAAGVWGFDDAPECNTVQIRAMRYFLGVHRFTARAAIEGDMGWEPCVVKQRAEVLRLWNRLVCLPEERLTRKILNWDRAHKYPWSKEVLEILRPTLHSLDPVVDVYFHRCGAGSPEDIYATHSPPLKLMDADSPRALSCNLPTDQGLTLRGDSTFSFFSLLLDCSSFCFHTMAKTRVKCASPSVLGSCTQANSSKQGITISSLLTRRMDPTVHSEERRRPRKKLEVVSIKTQLLPTCSCAAAIELNGKFLNPLYSPAMSLQCIAK
ncbi:hypothetical protein WMY93_007778 [Mugilogobius chulae]|uniref:Uncharacterized protein n=1 Tax=Mugilogobius chulae TaxID=88201 RepID=A0AAW0PMT0_9GOBI